MDKRHTKRVKVIQELYAHQFSPDNPHTTLSEKAQGILKNCKKIDKYINEAAPKFPIARIARVDLAILRLSMFDLLFEEEIPPKVVINEAVELAKEMGSGRSSAFINGVLGHFYTNYIEKETN